jgi:hypothetical protein
MLRVLPMGAHYLQHCAFKGLIDITNFFDLGKVAHACVTKLGIVPRQEVRFLEVCEVRQAGREGVVADLHYTR